MFVGRYTSAHDRVDLAARNQYKNGWAWRQYSWLARSWSGFVPSTPFGAQHHLMRPKPYLTLKRTFFVSDFTSSGASSYQLSVQSLAMSP